MLQVNLVDVEYKLTESRMGVLVTCPFCGATLPDPPLHNLNLKEAVGAALEKHLPCIDYNSFYGDGEQNLEAVLIDLRGNCWLWSQTGKCIELNLMGALERANQISISKQFQDMHKRRVWVLEEYERKRNE